MFKNEQLLVDLKLNVENLITLVEVIYFNLILDFNIVIDLDLSTLSMKIIYIIPFVLFII
jgi:hypothetical protein